MSVYNQFDVEGRKNWTLTYPPPSTVSAAGSSAMLALQIFAAAGAGPQRSPCFETSERPQKKRLFVTGQPDPAESSFRILGEECSVSGSFASSGLVPTFLLVGGHAISSGSFDLIAISFWWGFVCCPGCVSCKGGCYRVIANLR